jgi:hypothetical protein
MVLRALYWSTPVKANFSGAGASVEVRNLTALQLGSMASNINLFEKQIYKYRVYSKKYLILFQY